MYSFLSLSLILSFLTEPLSAAELHRQHGQGLSASEHRRRLKSFGHNVIDVQIPSVGKMFFDEVRTGRSVLRYNAVCLFVWCLYMLSLHLPSLYSSLSHLSNTYHCAPPPLHHADSASILHLSAVFIQYLVMGELLLLLCRHFPHHYCVHCIRAC